jgi:23S rRNA (guanosine2251-2'-O)-methyltransferase
MKIIIGRKPVLEALNSGEMIDHVYILFGQKGEIIDAIRITSKKKGVKCTELSDERFFSYTKDKNTQGVIALKSDQKYFDLNEIISSAKAKPYPLILILDTIQDPHNLGAILRTAECAGVDGVIITKHNSASVNETVVKTSAGASEHLKIYLANNLSNSIEELKKNNFWVIGSSLENSKDYRKQDYKIPLALIVGNEEKGIRRLTAELCDSLINIPMKGKIQSLNVSVATGILLFELLKQREF